MDTKQLLHSQVLDIKNSIENGYKSQGPDYYDGQYEKGQIISGSDFLSDALDINFTLSSNGEYLGSRILVAFGGPNIWIDTQHNTVEAYWGGDSFILNYTNDHMDIDDVCEEYCKCVISSN